MTYKIFSYGYQDEVLEAEFSYFSDAIHEMRKEWGGWPRRLEMPDGSNYEFPKTGEWKLKTIYKYFVLRSDENNFSAPQNYIMKELSKDKYTKMVIKSWCKKPVSYNKILGEDEEIVEAFVKLLGYGLIEIVDFRDGCGFTDKKWRDR